MGLFKSSEIFMALFSFVILNSFTFVNGTVTVISEITNETVLEIKNAPNVLKSFVGEGVYFYDIQGFLIMADPPDACADLQPPHNPYPGVEFPMKWILLAQNFGCKFQTKLESAKNAGYSAIIIHNVGDNSTQYVEVASEIAIYTCFIGEYDGEILRENYTYRSGFFIRIHDDFFGPNTILVILVGLCFTFYCIKFLLFIGRPFVRWTCGRCWMQLSRRRQLTLAESALKKLPTQKWKEGDPYETCAVCLDDFVEQDKIRVLPCAHAFHMVCIDPWIKLGKRVCPICKRRIVVADEHFSDFSSDTDDETGPLIEISTASTTQNSSSDNSTFVQQNSQSFRRVQRVQRNRQHRRSTSMNRQLLDSDTSSTDSRQSMSLRSRIHNSCPSLIKVHQIGRNAGQVSSYNNPQQRGLSRDDSHSPTYLSCQDARSQFMGGEENAGYVPERDSDEKSCNSKSSSQAAVSDMIAAEAENPIEIVQPPNGSILDTFHNLNLNETLRTSYLDSSPGSSE